MQNPFIDKIRQIILDHLDDEKFGVSQLASEIGLSKSQAFRKVKSLTNKSVNQIIRETRLQEAAKIILESDFHASEISYKVGFSSPSYFNNCFRKYYGITPGEYKEKYKEFPPKNGFDQTPSRSGINKFQTIFYILGAALLLYGIISLIQSKSTVTNTHSGEISIAVLYFEDYSPESDIQWFCNGITEEIITKLSGFKKLMVTSRTSVKQFRNSNLSIPEIAKILGVDYILEGSVRKDNDSIRITTQLINPKDKHEWSSNYDESFENALKLQNEVSKLIVRQLNIKLSQKEAKNIANMPTESLKAFQFFIEGRSFADKRQGIKPKNPNLEKSFRLFQKAIDLDPNFADAYAEMASVFMFMGGDHQVFEEVDKFKRINNLLEKSLQIDPNNVHAYSLKAWLYYQMGNDFEKAEEYFEKALALNPNDATTHYYYAQYFNRKPKPDFKKAAEHINIAQKLNPHATQINLDKIYFFLNDDRVSEAEEFYNRNKVFFTDDMKSKAQRNFDLYDAKKAVFEKKDWNEHIKYYHKKIEKEPNNASHYRVLANSYKFVLNDKDNYVKYAKKAYTIDSTDFFNAWRYYVALLECQKFLEAEKLKQTKNFESIFSKDRDFYFLFYSDYYQKNYKKAQVSIDSVIYTKKFQYAIVNAQQKKRKEAYQILNKNVLKYFEKAIVYAILKERDSMYYYINKESDIYRILEFNGFNEVDPYRKEERFKSLLRKNDIPLTHWNE